MKISHSMIYYLSAGSSVPVSPSLPVTVSIGRIHMAEDQEIYFINSLGETVDE